MNQKASLRIATLTTATRSPAGSHETDVAYHELEWYPNDRPNSSIVTAPSELPDTFFISSYQKEGSSTMKRDSLDKSLSKAASQSYIASVDAATFLSGNLSAYPSQKKNDARRLQQGSTVSVENAVFVLSKYSTAKENTMYKPDQYHAFKFSFQGSSSINNTSMDDAGIYRQLLMIRQPGLQRSGPMSTSKDLGPIDAFDMVEICSGLCLLSDEDLNMCTRNGSIQPKCLTQIPSTFSEKEVIARLSATIANTAALYLYGKQSKRTTSMRINLDIPSVQYYTNAFEALENGTCGANDVLEWIAAIKARRLRLFRAFSKAIVYGLQERGIPEDSVDITLSCGLKSAGEAIFWKLKNFYQSHDWIQEVLTAVSNDKDEFWSEYMQLLSIEEQRPRTWYEFSTLSYVYEVVKPVLRARWAARSVSTIGDASCLNEGQLLSNTQPAKARSAPSSPS